MSDSFGKALMAYYRGDRRPCFLRRDDGHIDEHKLDLYFSKYDDWPRYERESLEYARGRILDIGCGAGRHSLWLQEKGFEVLAIDKSPLAVQVARLRGVKDCRVMDAMQVDPNLGYFDTVILLGVNFGIGGNIENTKRFFSSLHKITARDARIITDSRDPKDTTNPDHLQYQELNRKRGRQIGQLTFRFEYDSEGNWFDLLIVCSNDMARICEDVGWYVQNIIEGRRGLYAAILTKKKTTR